MKNYRNFVEFMEQAVILAKARHGDAGKIELLFDKSCGMIDNLQAYEFN